jgi:hypothetical protein
MAETMVLVDALVAFDAIDIASSSRIRDTPTLLTSSHSRVAAFSLPPPPPKLPEYPEELLPRLPGGKKNNLVIFDRKGGQDMKSSSSSADTTAPSVATKVTTSAAK